MRGLSVVAVVLLFGLLTATAPTATAIGPNGTADAPAARLHAAYPNPIADGDAGEFVVISVRGTRSLAGLSLSDDEATTALPNATVSGRVVLSADPGAVPATAAGTRVAVPSLPALANGGEPLTLRAGERTLDRLTYADAPTDELTDGDRFRSLSATDRDPVGGGPATVTAFTLPDAPGAPLDVIRGTDDRLLLAGYTLSSPRVAEALIAARERGATVEVLLEGGPVGGITNRSAAVLDRLAAANVTVSMMDGAAAPYRYHHPKYAVADDRAVVLTENWKPSGVGGHSSRGWGVATTQSAVVEELVALFHADARNRSTTPWRRFRQGESFEGVPPPTGTYPSRFDPESIEADRVELLVAPDNAARRVEGLLDNATESIRIVQVSVGGPDDRLLQAAIRAAQRGVEVRLLLSSAWYTKADNRALASNLSAMADDESIPLSVRLADPNGRYEKVHAKGVIVDGEHVVVGSLNWNDNAYRNNREVVLLLSGERVAGYYGTVFDADWEGGQWRLPGGLLAVLLVVAVVAFAVGRKIRFRA